MEVASAVTEEAAPFEHRNLCNDIQTISEYLLYLSVCKRRHCSSARVNWASVGILKGGINVSLHGVQGFYCKIALLEFLSYCFYIACHAVFT